jgi:HK97 family phage portal protein
MLAKFASNIMQALMPSRSMSSDVLGRGPEADFWYQSAMGLPNLAGVVGGDNAWMFVSSSCAAMRILCGICANMPLERKRVEVKNGRATSNVMSTDPVHRLLNHKPNPIMTGKAFRSQMCGWQVGHGTAFAEIQREFPRNAMEAGQPFRLWPIHPSRLTKFFSDSDGSLWWHVRNNNGSTTDIPDSNMLRVPYTLMDDDGIHGLGVGRMAARSIGLGQTLERTEQDASSSSLPRIVIEAPHVMSMPEQDAFRHQWGQLFVEGGQNIPAILIKGMKAHALQWSATDSDHRGRREFNKLDLASWFGVPPSVLDGTEDMTLLFQKISLHYLEFWEPECEEKLLTQEERDSGQTWENDYKSLLKTDPVSRSTYYTNRFSLGSITPNEIRIAEGENPSETDNADVEHIQGAMRKLSDPYKAGAENPVGNPKDGKKPPLAKAAKAIRAARNAVTAMLVASMRRMSNKEMKEAKSASNSPGQFIQKMEEFYEKHKLQLSQESSAICDAANSVGWKLNPDRISAQWCQRSMELLLDASGCSISELRGAIEVCVSDWNSARVEEFVSSVQPKKKRAMSC